MIPLSLFSSVRRILALGAHSDDIESGLGGGARPGAPIDDRP